MRNPYDFLLRPGFILRGGLEFMGIARLLKREATVRRQFKR